MITPTAGGPEEQGHPILRCEGFRREEALPGILGWSKDTDRMAFKQGAQCGQSQVERKLASVYFGFGDLQVL